MAEPRPNPAQQIASQLKRLWERQSRSRRVLALGVLAAIVAVVGLSRLASHTTTWVPVAETGPDDAQELYATLSARGLAVRLREGKVEIEEGALAEARAIAAAAGLPRAGKGFELFEGSSLGQSSFAEQVNFRRALEGELARSITALAQVQTARVHIAFGKRSVFKEQDAPASGSVVLHLHPAQTLAAEQVRGVRQLVAASVDGLKPDAVVVLDQHGNPLDAAAPGVQDKRAELERTLTGRVRGMLERVVGAGKVSVVATAVLDETSLSETQELYDQSKPALRSESRTIEGDAAAGGIGGIAGTRGNLPGAPAATPTPGEGSAKRLQEAKNYEVNRTVRQVTRPEPVLQRLHVAVLVDHKLGADGKLVARTADELAELAALARQAAGIDEARGDKLEIRSLAFAAVEDPDLAAAAPAPAELPLVPIAIGGGVLFALVLLVLWRRARARKKRAQERPLKLALPAAIGELERVLEAEPTRTEAPELPPALEPRALPARSARDRVLEVVRGDAERAAEVLTAWLSEHPQAPAASRGAKP